MVAPLRSAEDLPQHVRVVRSLRPARICTVLPCGGEAWDWVPSAIRTLEAYTRTWGGEANVVLPITEEGHDEFVMRLVAAIDPDTWATYGATRRGQQLADPEAFEARLSREAEQWVERHAGSVDDARRMLTDDHMMRSPTSRPPTETLEPLILRGQSPHSPHGHLFTTGVQADEPIGRPATDLLSARQPLARRAVLSTDGLPRWAELIVAMSVGAVSPSFSEGLERIGSGVDVVAPDSDDVWSIVCQAWTISIRGTVEPWALGMTREGCHWYEPLLPGVRNRPLTVVCGSRPRHFAAALALNRLGGSALWLPLEAIEAASESPWRLSLLASEATRQAEERVVEVVCSADDAPVVSEFIATMEGHDPSVRFRVGDWSETSIPPARRLYDRNRFGRESYHPRVGHSLGTPIEPLLPSEFEADDIWSLHWQLDLHVAGVQYPPRTAVNDLLGGAVFNRGSIRASTDGLSSRSHSDGFVPGGATLEEAAFRPLLELPSFQRVVDALAARELGTCGPSSAGAFLLAACERFGGLQEFAQGLSGRPIGPLLYEFLAAAEAKGSDTITYIKNLDRGFVSFEQVRQLAGGEPTELADALDDLTERQILNRGYLLHCSTCAFDGWYSVPGDVSFTCLRCESRERLERRAWKLPPEGPVWYYRLDEAVFQALRQGTDVTALAIGRLGEGSASLLWLPETDFRDAQGELLGEVDLVVSVDGRLCVGEAKRGASLGSSRSDMDALMRKLTSIAELVSADEIVLASGEAFDERSQAAIERLRSGCSYEVRCIEDLVAS